MTQQLSVEAQHVAPQHELPTAQRQPPASWVAASLPASSAVELLVVVIVELVPSEVDEEPVLLERRELPERSLVPVLVPLEVVVAEEVVAELLLDPGDASGAPALNGAPPQ